MAPEEGAINFRLLEYLQVLVEESHVTNAAARLKMTQPKLSDILRRLRKITGDPILVRTPRGMIATPLARELAARSGDFMRSWSGLIGDSSSFSSEDTRHTFRVQALDSVTPQLIMPALKSLRKIAPNISLSVSMAGSGPLREILETGEIDIAIGQVPDVPRDLFISQLSTYKWCGIVAKDHPRVSDTPTLEAYAQEAHVMLTFGSEQRPVLTEQHVSQLLEEQGIRRRVAVYIPSVLAVPEIVANTDLIALLPRQAVEKAAVRSDLRLFTPPFRMPELAMAMIWHARTRNNPAHRWFRSLLRGSTTSA